MKTLKFCPEDGFILEAHDRCPECECVPENPILGQFSDEDAERMIALQISGQGPPG